MAEKKTYPFQGRQVPGQSIEFEGTAEPWTQYKLVDGTTVKVKPVLLDAVRLDEYNDQGDPVYLFTFQQLVGILAPEELKKKKTTN